MKKRMSKNEPGIESKIKSILKEQQIFFSSSKTKSLKFRIESLKKLKSVIKNNENNIIAALKKDFRKSEFESYITEIGTIYEEIDFILKHIKNWAKDKKVKTPFFQFPASSFIHAEPYGLTLVIAPWNYPVQLILSPLLGAIAAGNCCILKPSEFVPATSAILSKIIKEAYPENYIAVIEGDAKVNIELLKQNFDLIFFTGSIPVGKLVMKAAAKNLTPVVLELGGKSPCIIDKNINIEKTAKRIVWGKFLNAGQTCVAPDYLLLHKDIKTKFIKSFKEQLVKSYGNKINLSDDFPRIINEKHFDRLEQFLKQGEILIGGDSNKNDLYIEPTLIDKVSLTDSIMQEEIFGPILPILEYENIDQAIKIINSQAKALALYIFSENKIIQNKVLAEVSFGGGCINDVVMHLANPNLPFGGVGPSGMGSYHGKASFDSFSHHKSIFKNCFTIDIPLRYAPYKNKLKFIKTFFK